MYSDIVINANDISQCNGLINSISEIIFFVDDEIRLRKAIKYLVNLEQNQKLTAAVITRE